MGRNFVIAVLATLLVLSGAGIYLLLTRENVSVSGTEETLNQNDLEGIRPRKMKIVETGNDFFVVEWQTNSEVVGYIKYGDTSTSLQLMAQDVQGSTLLRSHRVRVDGLVPGRKYYFWVMSDNVAFGKSGRALEVLTLGSS